MNFHVPISDVVDVNMTSKGQVLIPKAIRDRLGLIPGRTVSVGINERGQAVVVPRIKMRDETPEQRRARIRAAIDSVRGTVDLGGMTTDEYMAEIRGPYPDDL